METLDERIKARFKDLSEDQQEEVVITAETWIQSGQEDAASAQE